jgi:MraZ protein
MEKDVGKWKIFHKFASIINNTKKHKIMALFIGEQTSKLDDKGRLIFPSEFRMQAGAANVQYVVQKDVLCAGSLAMYSLDEWAKRSELARSKINLFTREGVRAWEEFNRDRVLVTPDEKMGRITIPKFLLDYMRAQKEVTFVGEDNIIRLWAKEAWQAGVEEDEKRKDEERANLIEKLLG